ncbi:MAG: cyclophilin-like fold protein [Thermodesulfobacteriota bacterium]
MNSLKISIKASDMSVAAVLLQTPTAHAIYEALPLDGTANVWGDEIYFDIPLQLELEEDAREEVAVGDLAYWPSGPAFCIFFGPTPVSRDETPRAYSPVNVFGRVQGDATVFNTVADGATIRVEKTG